MNSKKGSQKRLILRDANEKKLMFQSTLFGSTSQIPHSHQLKVGGQK